MSPVDADIAGELDAAKRYAATDPQAALAKLRNVLQRTVRLAFVRLTHCDLPSMATLNDLLDDPRFVAVVPLNVLERMHDVRMRGNRAVHAEPVSVDDIRRAMHNIDA